jgi:hypothetical protein
VLLIVVTSLESEIVIELEALGHGLFVAINIISFFIWWLVGQ